MSGRVRRQAVVVGAHGFLGGAVARHLAATGELAAAYSRQHPFLDADGNPDPDLLAADTVFWLAGSIKPATASGADPGAADRAALTSLLDAIEGRGTRVVIASSGGTVYDFASRSPHRESAPLKPSNQYGDAMLALESLVNDRAAQPCVVRLANPYGPGQRAKSGQGVVAHWFAAVDRHEPIVMMGSEAAARDYVYIADVVEGMSLIHRAAQVPATVNIGSGEPTSLGELARHVVQAVGHRDVKVEHLPARSFDVPSTWLDVSLAEEKLGWRPTTTLEVGLKSTWAALIGIER